MATYVSELKRNKDTHKVKIEYRNTTIVEKIVVKKPIALTDVRGASRNLLTSFTKTMSLKEYNLWNPEPLIFLIDALIRPVDVQWSNCL